MAYSRSRALRNSLGVHPLGDRRRIRRNPLEAGLEPRSRLSSASSVHREDGRFDGSLLVNGSTVERPSADVEAGGSQDVTATHVFERPGSYDLCLEGSCVTVAVDGEDDPGRPRDSSSDEAGSETGEEAGGTDAETGNDGSDAGLPGFGAVAALVSIALVGAGLARRS